MRTIPSVGAALLLIASSSLAGAAPAAAPPSPPPSSAATSIGALTKEHNVDAGNGALAVRITVPTDLVGLTGQTVAAVLWLYDADGQPIRAAVPGWGDASNQYRIISRDIVPVAARQQANFDFKVPYCGFPRRSQGRYQVEARAVLVQRAGDGRVVLARRSTTFFVE